MEGLILTDPVQNVGHTSLRAAPSPCASHAERYGDRTARGTLGGLKGVAVHETAATAVPANQSPKDSRKRKGENMENEGER